MGIVCGVGTAALVNLRLLGVGLTQNSAVQLWRDAHSRGHLSVSRSRYFPGFCYFRPTRRYTSSTPSFVSKCRFSSSQSSFISRWFAGRRRKARVAALLTYRLGCGRWCRPAGFSSGTSAEHDYSVLPLAAGDGLLLVHTRLGIRVSNPAVGTYRSSDHRGRNGRSHRSAFARCRDEELSGGGSGERTARSQAVRFCRRRSLWRSFIWSQGGAIFPLVQLFVLDQGRTSRADRLELCGISAHRL